jgi:tRNA (guanine-N7-)-methyltransferase
MWRRKAPGYNAADLFLTLFLLSMSADTPLNEQGRPMLYDPTEHRIRSFVTRAGRLSTAQARALEELGPQFLIEYRKAQFDFHAPFGRKAPLVLEIGFGMGDTTAHIAKAMPDRTSSASKCTRRAWAACSSRSASRTSTNLRLIQHDAVEVLNNMIADGSLAGVHVFFPDPWHKARHNKRRLIQPAFVKLLCQKLAPGGYIHCATDWEDYAVQMLEVLGAEPQLENTRRRLCREAGLPSADQVREPRPEAGPRRVGPGVQAQVRPASSFVPPLSSLVA